MNDLLVNFDTLSRKAVDNRETRMPKSDWNILLEIYADYWNFNRDFCMTTSCSRIGYPPKLSVYILLYTGMYTSIHQLIRH